MYYDNKMETTAALTQSLEAALNQADENLEALGQLRPQRSSSRSNFQGGIPSSFPSNPVRHNSASRLPSSRLEQTHSNHFIDPRASVSQDSPDRGSVSGNYEAGNSNDRMMELMKKKIKLLEEKLKKSEKESLNQQNQIISLQQQQESMLDVQTKEKKQVFQLKDQVSGIKTRVDLLINKDEQQEKYEQMQKLLTSSAGTSSFTGLPNNPTVQFSSDPSQDMILHELISYKIKQEVAKQLEAIQGNISPSSAPAGSALPLPSLPLPAMNPLSSEATNKHQQKHLQQMHSSIQILQQEYLKQQNQFDRIQSKQTFLDKIYSELKDNLTIRESKYEEQHRKSIQQNKHDFDQLYTKTNENINDIMKKIMNYTTENNSLSELLENHLHNSAKIFTEFDLRFLDLDKLTNQMNNSLTITKTNHLEIESKIQELQESFQHMNTNYHETIPMIQTTLTSLQENQTQTNQIQQTNQTQFKEIYEHFDETNTLLSLLTNKLQGLDTKQMHSLDELQITMTQQLEKTNEELTKQQEHLMKYKKKVKDIITSMSLFQEIKNNVHELMNKFVEEQQKDASDAYNLHTNIQYLQQQMTLVHEQQAMIQEKYQHDLNIQQVCTQLTTQLTMDYDQKLQTVQSNIQELFEKEKNQIKIHELTQALEAIQRDMFSLKDEQEQYRHRWMNLIVQEVNTNLNQHNEVFQVLKQTTEEQLQKIMDNQTKVLIDQLIPIREKLTISDRSVHDLQQQLLILEDSFLQLKAYQLRADLSFERSSVPIYPSTNGHHLPQLPPQPPQQQPQFNSSVGLGSMKPTQLSEESLMISKNTNILDTSFMNNTTNMNNTMNNNTATTNNNTNNIMTTMNNNIESNVMNYNADMLNRPMINEILLPQDNLSFVQDKQLIQSLLAEPQPTPLSTTQSSVKHTPPSMSSRQVIPTPSTAASSASVTSSTSSRPPILIVREQAVDTNDLIYPSEESKPIQAYTGIAFNPVKTQPETTNLPILPDEKVLSQNHVEASMIKPEVSEAPSERSYSKFFTLIDEINSDILALDLHLYKQTEGNESIHQWNPVLSSATKTYTKPKELVNTTTTSSFELPSANISANPQYHDHIFKYDDKNHQLKSSSSDSISLASSSDNEHDLPPNSLPSGVLIPNKSPELSKMQGSKSIINESLDRSFIVQVDEEEEDNEEDNRAIEDLDRVLEGFQSNLSNLELTSNNYSPNANMIVKRLHDETLLPSPLSTNATLPFQSPILDSQQKQQPEQRNQLLGSNSKSLDEKDNQQNKTKKSPSTSSVTNTTTKGESVSNTLSPAMIISSSTEKDIKKRLAEEKLVKIQLQEEEKEESEEKEIDNKHEIQEENNENNNNNNNQEESDDGIDEEELVRAQLLEIKYALDEKKHKHRLRFQRNLAEITKDMN